MKQSFFFIFIFGMMLFSCTKSSSDELLPKASSHAATATERTDDELTGPIQLGAQIDNPLSTDNMLTAWNNLYTQQLSSLAPNRLYVRFLPTIDEYKKLQAIEALELFDHPIDRSILTEGSHYRAPGLAENQITWQYAIVDADFESPVATYEVLDEMVVVEYNSHWVEEAYRIKELNYNGKPYGTFDADLPVFSPPTNLASIPPPPDECPPGCILDRRIDDSTVPATWEWYCDCSGNDDPPPPPSQVCGCSPTSNPRMPSGSVRVWDTQHDGGRWEGVEGVKVFTWRKGVPFGAAWGKSTYTNQQGCWRINRAYKKTWSPNAAVTIGIKVKFKNKNLIIRAMQGTWDWLGYVEAVKEVRSVTGTDLRNICIEYNVSQAEGEPKKRYHAATAMNAFYEYNDFASQDGVHETDQLDFLFHPLGGGATAPMFDRLNGNLLAEIGFAFGISQVINVMTGSTLGTIVAPFVGVTWVFAPDIAFDYSSSTLANRGLRSDYIKATLFHELAHASHFEKAGTSFWLDNIFYMIENAIAGAPTYGTGNAPGAGRTAVIESWGFHYGPSLAHRLYGSETSLSSGSYLIDLESTYLRGGFIPAGLPHDLIDFNTLGNSEPMEVANDGFGGFSHADIFSQLDKETLSLADLKAALKLIKPSGVSNGQIDLLFSDYNY